MVKNDVSPQDIFRLQRGSDSDRAIIGKYKTIYILFLVNLSRTLSTIPIQIEIKTFGEKKQSEFGSISELLI